jgi:hypothetical protein
LSAISPPRLRRLSFIRSRVERGTTLHADEAGSWNDLHSRYEMRGINHQEAYSTDESCTNWAETFFSRLHRGEIGHHHHVAGPYLIRFAQEASWREKAASDKDFNHSCSQLSTSKLDYRGLPGGPSERGWLRDEP